MQEKSTGMKINNFLVVLLAYYVNTACSTLKIENSAECSLDTNILKNKILQNNKFVKKVEFGVASSNVSLSNNCNGLYFLYVNEWKGIKNNLNYVQIPIILCNDDYYINMDFINGREIKKNNLNTKIEVLKSELLENFDENSTNEILEKFKYEIEVTPKGRFF